MTQTEEDAIRIPETVLQRYPKEGVQLITTAFDMAKDVMKDKLRENGHPFIEHPLGVATIVAEDLNLDYNSVTAVFLHESIRFRPELLQNLPKGKFPADIIDIAVSLNKIAAIKPKETRLEAENYKRLIVSYSKDPRVTLIKLADRLEVMRNIDLLPKSSQERKVTETMLLYIPIAHQLGLYKLKGELENIFFRFTEPEKYREITNKLAATATDRENMLRTFIEPIKKRLETEGIKAHIKQRTKAAYSIWKKMQKQEIPFEKVMDVSAARIIIDAGNVPLQTEQDLCWKVYSIVTEQYKPDISRLRDWISKPKENGYESLHTTVCFKDDVFMEVQIRTERMDFNAENGNAAHWSYKGIKQEKGLTPWLQGLRNVLESDNRSNYEYVSNFLSEDVFAFTPDGELRRLPKGATVLDFAFNIHSNLGIKCSGAMINGKVVPIREKIHTGDVVEIISNKNQKPSADWLSIVVSSKARNRIKLKLKEESIQKAASGKEMVERRLKNWKLELNDEDLMQLCKKNKLKNFNDFFAAVADESIDIMSIKAFLSTEKEGQCYADDTKKEDTKQDSCRSSEGSDYLTIDGSSLSHVSYSMAKCCNPIYGDEVFGFVSVKDGIKIHRMSCPNAARLIENYPYRIQKVRWKDSATSGSFQTGIKVIVDDKSVYTKLIETATGLGASMRSSSITPKTGRHTGEYDIRFTVYVSNNSTLDKIISAFRKTKGVLSALRTSK